MRLRVLQNSLVSGTLDAAARGRNETALYKNGAGQMINCRQLTAGGTVSRWGTNFCDLLGGPAVLHAFQFSLAQSYVAAFMAGEVRFFYADTGLPAGGLTGCPWTTTPLRELRVAGGGDLMFVTHPGFEMRIIRRLSVDTWSIETMSYESVRARPAWRYAKPGITVQAGGTCAVSVTLAAQPSVSGTPLTFSVGQPGQARLNSGSPWLPFTITSISDLTLNLAWSGDCIPPGTAAEWQFAGPDWGAGSSAGTAPPGSSGGGDGGGGTGAGSSAGSDAGEGASGSGDGDGAGAGDAGSGSGTGTD